MRLAKIVLSILIGIATHILWDSFTHSGYWISDHLHFLRTVVSMPLFGPRPVFGILQYLSSAIGIVFICSAPFTGIGTRSLYSNPDRHFLTR